MVNIAVSTGSSNMDEDMNLRPGSPTRLNRPLDLSALLKDGRTQLCLDIDPMSQESDFNAKFDPEAVFKQKLINHVNFDVLTGGSDDKEDENLSPFEKIRKRMTAVTKDGGVMKRIIKEGSGEVVPPNSHIKIHYQAYTEYQEVPFDVSILRSKKPLSFKLGGPLLRGLDIGVGTMKTGEVSWFLVHHDYAYGKLGCGNRIPKEATILFEVTLVSYSENPDVLTSEPDQKLTFPDVVERVEAHLKKGNERKTQDNDTELAIKHYKEARNLILDFNLSNDHESTLAKQLNRAYQNLAICYNLNRDFKTTCKLAEDAMHVIPQLAEKNIKLKFAWGKALNALNEYDAAAKLLKEVKQKEPANKEITKELLSLEEKIRKYTNATKVAAQKFFKSEKPKEEKGLSLTDSFVESMTEQLEKFKLSDTVGNLNLSPGMTVDEREAVKSIADKLKLHYVQLNIGGQGEKIMIRKN
ncbi:unnamed protein product [Bemisia tabaci]|uniref:peptidylprolyl isomerase n=1 Tax=Bemisia tabaci TaxID=7038 RepID=A0A9P0A4Q4_BEMTA|nr:unnamed protein product [Bemisia tabaci]